MKIKRAISTLLAIWLAMTFCGCQLAREGAGGTSGNDRFIGVLITREYLDLFDTEGYLNDNMQNLSDGEMNMDASDAQYQGRLYATVQEDARVDTYGGQITLYKYSFPSVDGMAFFTPNDPASSESGYSFISSYDEAICDTTLNIDADVSIEQSGTIYIAMNCVDMNFFFNPVYQTEDDRIYVLSAGGNEFVGYNSEGPMFSETHEQKTVVTENGRSKEMTSATTVSIEIMNPPKKIVITQLDQNSEIVTSAEFVPGELPEVLTPEASTEYIILETYKTDSDGAQVVTRELLTSEDDTLMSFCVGENDICLPQCTRLEW